MSAALDVSNNFTPVQLRVLALLATGQTITATAAACQIDRTTFHHWRRNDPAYSIAAQDAAADAAETYRIAAQPHASAALATLCALMDNPETPASVRLKAALHILLAAQPAPPAQAPLGPERPAPIASRPRPTANSSEFITNLEIISSTPGRNTPCPCHSGRKYKQCCLNKPERAPLPAAAA